jgi:hypothetical protein
MRIIPSNRSYKPMSTAFRAAATARNIAATSPYPTSASAERTCIEAMPIPEDSAAAAQLETTV